MKTILTVLFSVSMGVALLGLGWIGGYVVGVTQPIPTPEIQVVTVEVQQPPLIVDRYVTVPVTVTQIVEVLVTPTPAPVLAITAPPEPVVTEEAALPCYDAAWVLTQPRSDLQAGALEKGKGKRLTFRIRNEGTCVWDGYVLSSDGVFPDIQIPYTQPGEVAEFWYDFTAYQPLEARFYIVPTTTEGALLLGNSASPGAGLETMYYRLDVKVPAFRAPGFGGASYVCDSKG